MKSAIKYFIALVHFLHNDAHQFSSCSSSNGLGLKTINLVPDPPEVGNKLTITFSGVAQQEISSGSRLNIDISVLGIKITNKDFDICRDLSISCPVKVGQTYSSNFSYNIPSDAPKGISVEAKLIGYSSSGSEISCQELTTKIGKRSEIDKVYRNSFGVVDNELKAFRISETLFRYWRDQHKWRFNSLVEYIQRLYQFHYNNQIILRHNSRPNSGYRLGHNQFSHLSNIEFRHYNGFKPGPVDTTTPRQCANTTWVATAVDWREKGAVTPVKNQGNCGSCWAFSTTGAMEGSYYLEGGKLVSFSEQELVSCDGVDQGCNGGLMDNAFSWIHNHSGLCSESDYPYNSGNGGNQSCQVCHPVNGSKVVSIVDVNSTETELLAAISKQPVAIAIEADGIMFQLYRDGVFSTKCGTNLDHGVLAVGYGTDASNQNYWLVKNSWGSTWGDKGYIKLSRDVEQKGGQCGILLSASYPVLG